MATEATFVSNIELQIERRSKLSRAGSIAIPALLIRTKKSKPLLPV